MATSWFAAVSNLPSASFRRVEAMAVEVVSSDRDGLCLLSVAGTLDSGKANTLRNELAKLEKSCQLRFLLDFSGLEKVETAGFRKLCGIAKRLKIQGGNLSICGLRPDVRRVFDQAPRLSGSFTIRDSCEESIRLERLAQIAGSLLRQDIPWRSRLPDLEPDETRLELAARLLGLIDLPESEEDPDEE